MPQDVNDPNYVMGHIYAVEQAIQALAAFLPQDEFYAALHRRLEQFRVLAMNSKTSEASIAAFDDATAILEAR